MGTRVRQFLQIVVVVLLVACPPLDEPPRVGEFPVFVGVRGDHAFLVTYFYYRTDEPGSATLALRLSRLDREADLLPVTAVTLPAPWYEFGLSDRISATVTNSSGKATVFGWMDSPQGLLAFRADESGAVLTDLDVNFDSCGDDRELRVVDRGASGSWVFFASCWLGSNDSFPMIAFDGPNIRLEATQVLWAHCGSAYCQQLRLIDNTILRLYAAPATGGNLALQTEVAVSPDYGQRYSSCHTRAHGLVFRFAGSLFALSATAPSLRTLPDPTSEIVAAMESECPPPKTRPALGNLPYAPNVATFPSGETVWAYEQYQRSPEDPNCDFFERYVSIGYGGCKTLHHIYETRVALFGPTGEKVTSYPVHDY